MTLHVMTFGKYKGQLPDKIPTQYLFFVLCKENIRHSYPEDTAAALAELRDRFVDFDAIVAELEIKSPPTKYYLEVKAKAERRRAELAAAKKTKADDHQAWCAHVKKRRAEIAERNALRDRIAANPGYADDLV